MRPASGHGPFPLPETRRVPSLWHQVSSPEAGFQVVMPEGQVLSGALPRGRAGLEEHEVAEVLGPWWPQMRGSILVGGVGLARADLQPVFMEHSEREGTRSNC